MSSLRSDSHHPPSDDVDDPLILKLEKPLTLPMSFDSREQFWWNILSLSGRCLTTALSLSFLVLGLLIFSRMGELSLWEQRGFNAITILLSAFASLGLGSMFGYLGSMLRWPLLARAKYKMQDIELLLAMPSPSGSAALIFEHFREWRLSMTTLIVLIYLLVNITGRFSIAIFGLVFNLVNVPVVIPPTLITNWDSTILLTRNATDTGVAEKELRSYLDLTEGGLATLTRRPEIDFNLNEFLDLTENTLYTLAVNGTVLEQDGNTVEFTYSIKDFNGIEPVSSDHTVHSSASCTMFRVEGSEYWKNYSGSDQASKNWQDENNGEDIAEVIRVLDAQNAWAGDGSEWVTWATPLAGKRNGSSFALIHYPPDVVYDATVWECTSTLFERKGQAPHPQPLFNSASLFLLPIANEVERGVVFSASVLTSTTEVVSEHPITYTRSSVTKSTDTGAPNPGVITSTSAWAETSTSLSTAYRTWTVTAEPVRAGKTTSIAYRWFGELQSRTSPSVGVQKLNFYGNGERGSDIQRQYYSLYVAALIARLPIAAIAYGNQVFPRKLRDPKAGPTRHVLTTLEVKWHRVWIAAGIVVVGQVLAIMVVLYYCRNVYVREDSYLVTAELLKTVLSKIGDGSMMTTVELEDALDKVLKGPVSYGTVSGVQGDYPRVALGGNGIRVTLEAILGWRKKGSVL
ncbi:unnamed protein product [Tuber aestivum]|uniref:Uncharacterized protein n=1 Tax=Tuber aestivum TaxID=59557 RepID=A0A292PTN7_9PEZI|nr:unnamed protein product [Tuber aestivum]